MNVRLPDETPPTQNFTDAHRARNRGAVKVVVVAEACSLCGSVR
jgi:hypothetical protein